MPQPGDGTQYESWRWGEAAELLPAARRGSLCARVLLRERGIAPDYMAVKISHLGSKT